MAIVVADAALEDMAEALIASVEAGSGASTIELLAANGTTVLAILDLATVWATAAAEVITVDCTPALATVGEAAASTGTAATLARLKDGDGTVIMSGFTVGTSGTDFIMSPSNTVVEAEAVEITAGTITLPNAAP
jgi:hypothetical protein